MLHVHFLVRCQPDIIVQVLFFSGFCTSTRMVTRTQTPRHAHTHRHAHTQARTHTGTHTHRHTHTGTHTHMHAHTQARTHTGTHTLARTRAQHHSPSELIEASADGPVHELIVQLLSGCICPRLDHRLSLLKLSVYE